MKRIILSLSVLLILGSCQQQNSKNQRQAIEDQVNTELSKNKEKETIFLGLRFGMGGEEVHNYFRELVKQDKLLLLPHEYLSEKGKIYMYRFEFGDQDFQSQDVLGTFKAFYIKDKLYKLRISAEGEDDLSVDLLKEKFKEEYVSKYGKKYITRESIYNNSEVYVWIDGNMMIEISEGLNKNILIIYTDLIAVKENKGTPREVLIREI